MDKHQMDKQSGASELQEMVVSRRWREADARRVLEVVRESGQSLSAFARQHGFHPQRLYFWRAQLVPATIAFGAQVQVSVRLAFGVVVEVADSGAVAPEWLVAVVRGLSR